MTRNISPKYKTIVDMFNSLVGQKTLWEIYNDFITCAACAIQNSFLCGKRREEIEDMYMNIIKKYSKEEAMIFPKILAEIVNMLEENPHQDLLGGLYMELDMGSKEHQQIFTPYSVAYAMAKMTLQAPEIREGIEKEEWIKLSEPSIGGGANVIASCQVLEENGINYQKNLIVVGQDLNQTAALMSYIVLSLLGVAAVIKIGDTLCDPYVNYRTERQNNKNIWITPMFAVNNCFDKV